MKHFSHIAALKATAFSAGCILILLSATINVRHAITATSDPIDDALIGALAVAVTIGFSTLPAVSRIALGNGAPILALLAFVASLICGAVSLVTVAGASLSGRVASSIGAEDAAEARSTRSARLETVQSELRTIGTQRPSTTIRADLDAKLATRTDLAGCDAKWLESSRARSI